ELASDHAGIANVWKYFIGQTRGLKRLDVKSKKEEIEKDFINWYKKNDETNEKYGNVLQNLQAAYQQMEGTITPFYLIAIGSSNIECLNLSMQTVVMEEMLEKKKENKAQIELTIDALKETSEEFYSDYNISMDRDMLSSMLSLFKKRLSLNQLPDIFATINAKFNGDINSYVDYVFKNSIFTDKDRYNKFLSNPKVKTLKKDPINELSSSFNKIIASYQANLAEGQQNVSLNMRKFIAGLREMNPSVKYYPDANSSMRFTYGTIKDYYPADAVHYDYITHAKGILEKEDPTNEEFIVSPKLKELIKKGDFGIYGKDGDLVINFLSTNDITGGNSGSPVINGKGELIGIAFDGNWEAMSGDIAFENELQRTISVDIRYVLFVIDKYAGAKHLIDELTLVK
ncbi:MAG TPA: S46 family peptidase, partial [Bacteroidales bacterium]|nr:S46 family peptidase [Bacteroidales bacterium]